MELFAPMFSVRDEVAQFFEEWNKHIFLPKLIKTDRQASVINDAMHRSFFREHWRASIKVIAKSTFLWTKMKPTLKIDWYLKPDNFDKIMEGFYLDPKYQVENNSSDDELIP